MRGKARFYTRLVKDSENRKLLGDVNVTIQAGEGQFDYYATIEELDSNIAALEEIRRQYFDAEWNNVTVTRKGLADTTDPDGDEDPYINALVNGEVPDIESI
jgi:hypothetical protein